MPTWLRSGALNATIKIGDFERTIGGKVSKFMRHQVRTMNFWKIEVLLPAEISGRKKPKILVVKFLT